MKLLESRDVIRKLVEAGILANAEDILRVVITLEKDAPVLIETETVTDERLLAVLCGGDHVTVNNYNATSSQHKPAMSVLRGLRAAGI